MKTEFEESSEAAMLWADVYRAAIQAELRNGASSNQAGYQAAAHADKAVEAYEERVKR